MKIKLGLIVWADHVEGRDGFLGALLELSMVLRVSRMVRTVQRQSSESIMA
jgi:hypothetical protein